MRGTKRTASTVSWGLLEARYTVRYYLQASGDWAGFDSANDVHALRQQDLLKTQIRCWEKYLELDVEVGCILDLRLKHAPVLHFRPIHNISDLRA